MLLPESYIETESYRQALIKNIISSSLIEGADEDKIYGVVFEQLTKLIREGRR